MQAVHSKNSTANRLAQQSGNAVSIPGQSPGQPKEVEEEAIAPAMTSGYRIRMKDASCSPAICFTDCDMICEVTAGHYHCKTAAAEAAVAASAS